MDSFFYYFTNNTLTKIKIFISISISFFVYSCTSEELQDIQIENKIITRNIDDENNWDWTNPAEYDYAYIQGIGQIKISSPFNTLSTPNKDLSSIIAQKDYLPQQGWVLLDKVLGTPQNMVETPYPYFILYNKFRGILRIFMLNTNPNEHNHAILSLEWAPGKSSSLLTFGNKYPFADDKYSNTNNQEKIVSIIDDYYNSAWFVSDFLVSFDHNLKHDENYNLIFKMYSQVQSNLTINGNFQFETVSASLTNSSNSSNLGDLLGKTGNFIKKLPGSSEIEKGLNQLKLKKDTTNIVNRNLYNNIAQLTNSIADGSFGQILRTFGGISSGLKGTIGILTSIFNVFVGKSTTAGPTYVELMPTISDGTAVLNGTITTQTNATQCMLQLPGTNHRYSDGSLNINGLPIYDKPLGVFSLENLPSIKKKTLPMDYMVTISHPGGHGTVEVDFRHREIYSLYQFDDDIRIALNKNCDLEYLCGTAQLISDKLPQKLPEKFSRFPDAVSPYIAHNIFMTINDSSYSTRPIDLEKFKGTSFLTPTGQNVYLKLTIALKPNNTYAEQTPVIISQMYLLSNIIEEGSIKATSYDKDQWYVSSSYPLTSEQLPSSIIHGKNALILTKY